MIGNPASIRRSKPHSPKIKIKEMYNRLRKIKIKESHIENRRQTRFSESPLPDDDSQIFPNQERKIKLNRDKYNHILQI